MITLKKHQGLSTAALSMILTLLVSGCATTTEPEPMPVAEPEPVVEEPAPVAAPAPEPEPEIVIKPSAPETYVVVKGDTLWDISTMYLQDPWYWPEIWHANPQIANPHLIFPGDVITLYYVGGKPRLTVDGGPRIEGLPTNKLEPQIRTSDLSTDDLVIPVQSVQSFIIRPDVLDEKSVNGAPYIVGTQEGRLIYGEGYTVYVKGLEDAKPNDQFDIYHPNKKLYDPDTGKVLGIETLYVGSAVVLAGGEPATVKLSKMTREALRNDILFPSDDFNQDRNFMPHPPPEGMSAKIISLHKALVQVGQYQVAVIDVGAKDGVEKGHVFVTYRKGSVVAEGPRSNRLGAYSKTQLPDEKSGLMMIFRVLDEVSYGLMMDSLIPVRIGDLAKAP